MKYEDIKRRYWSCRKVMLAVETACRVNYGMTPDPDNWDGDAEAEWFLQMERDCESVPDTELVRIIEELCRDMASSRFTDEGIFRRPEFPDPDSVSPKSKLWGYALYRSIKCLFPYQLALWRSRPTGLCRPLWYHEATGDDRDYPDVSRVPEDGLSRYEAEMLELRTGVAWTGRTYGGIEVLYRGPKFMIEAWRPVYGDGGLSPTAPAP